MSLGIGCAYCRNTLLKYIHGMPCTNSRDKKVSFTTGSKDGVYIILAKKINKVEGDE